MYGLVLDKLGHLVNSLSSLIAMTGTGIPKYLQPECTGEQAIASILELASVSAKALSEFGIADARFSGSVIRSRTGLNGAKTELDQQRRAARKDGPQGSLKWAHSNLALDVRVSLVAVDAASSAIAASRSRSGERSASATRQRSQNTDADSSPRRSRSRRRSHSAESAPPGSSAQRSSRGCEQVAAAGQERGLPPRPVKSDDPVSMQRKVERLSEKLDRAKKELLDSQVCEVQSTVRTESPVTSGRPAAEPLVHTGGSARTAPRRYGQVAYTFGARQKSKGSNAACRVNIRSSRCPNSEQERSSSVSCTTRRCDIDERSVGCTTTWPS